MVDFMSVDQGRAWLEYKSIGQAGIYSISRLEFRYAGVPGIFIEECQHMLRYAGLTYLICCAGAGRPDYLTFIGRWSGI
jgi:hypothetical protein